MADLDELDALHAAATAGEWVVRSYQEPSGEFNPAPSWEVYDEDNLVISSALHNAWPTVSARLRAAEAEVERLRALSAEARDMWRGMPWRRGGDALVTRLDRAALGEP